MHVKPTAQYNLLHRRVITPLHSWQGGAFLVTQGLHYTQTLHAYESKDRQGRRLRSIVTAPGSRRLYLATTHFSGIMLQQKHTENVTANSVPFQKRHETQPDCSLSASRNSCLRLNLNINVETRALCFASKYGARARCEALNEVWARNFANRYSGRGANVRRWFVLN